MRLVRDRSDAEDVLQETYLRAWKSFDRFEIGTNCRAWLFKILFYVVLHHRRTWFHRKRLEDESGDLENSLVYEAPAPDDIRDEDVLAAIEKVPLVYREVVLLADVQEFAYKEIAEMLGIPIGTVMSRLSRGRARLRAELTVASRSEGLGGGKNAP